MNQDITTTMLENGNLLIQIKGGIRRVNGRRMVYCPTAPTQNILEPVSAKGDADDGLRLAVAKAHIWTELLESGKIKTISDLASQLKTDASYISKLLRLTTLSPNIIEAILNPEVKKEVPTPSDNELSISRLIQSFPELWHEQEKELIAQ
jgi:hypothetical protein